MSFFLLLALGASDELLPFVVLLLRVLVFQVFSTLELIDKAPFSVHISSAHEELAWVLEVESILEEGNGFVCVLLELGIPCLRGIVAHDDPLESIPVDEDRVNGQVINPVICFPILHKILNKERSVW